MNEQGITKNQILSELSKSPHGKLTEYVRVGKLAAMQEPEFLAHLISWDSQKGQIRDAKVAIPVVSLSVPGFPEELAENSLAHLGLLGPRELVRASRFALELRLPGNMRKVRRLIERYLRDREAHFGRWQRTAVQHRNSLKELYSLAHVKPNSFADSILFKGERPKGSVFAAIAELKNMSPIEAAGTIMEYKIPFLIAMGALGEKAKNTDLVLALLDRMTPTEVVTNTKMLERLGVKDNPALRGAFKAALERASKSTKNVLKTTRAAEAIDDEELKANLRGLQEKQIQTLGGVDGNWLVLGDKSGSMSAAIELAREISATLAKMVKGKVYLVFFDTTPQAIDVTGLSLDAIKAKTKYVRAGGGTSIGSGLRYALDNKLEIDGIAIVSDGGENSGTRFHEVYRQYSTFAGKDVPVYLYQTRGDYPSLITNMQTAGIELQTFDMMNGVDYYSLPNTVATMRTNRYSLLDEVMATKLLTLDDVFKSSAVATNMAETMAVTA